MNHYYQVVIEIATEYLPLFEEKKMELYSDFECDGIEDFSIDEATVDEILGEKSISGGEVSYEVIEQVESSILKKSDNLSFSYFFYGENAKDRSEDLHFYVSSNFPQFQSKILEKKERDWNEEWKKFYAPIDVSENLRIVPSWYEGKKEKRDLSIYPGFGFGTGNHPTTFLCLKALEKLSLNHSFQKVLDFGCGSGILGIAAIKFGGKELFFYDIDPSSIVNTKQNIGLNGLQEEDYFLGDYERKNDLSLNSYDLIFANILLETLKEEKKAIDSLIEDRGYLILSGILSEQVDDIKSYYLQDRHYKMEALEEYDGWCAMILRRTFSL